MFSETSCIQIMWRGLEASLVCRQTDKTNVHLAGITRRKCSCMNPRKVYQFKILSRSFHLPWYPLFSSLCESSSPGIFSCSLTVLTQISFFCVWTVAVYWLYWCLQSRLNISFWVPENLDLAKFSLEKPNKSAGSLDFFFFTSSVDLYKPQINSFSVLSMRAFTHNLPFWFGFSIPPISMQWKSNI